MFVYKKSNCFSIKLNYKPMKRGRLFYINVNDTKTSFCQKFINYLSPVNLKSLSNNT